ncbi:MAG TPA: arylsulfatase [Chloroflexota bacterium]|nr:arylsulfatase [Chloroflexota bacterium]
MTTAPLRPPNIVVILADDLGYGDVSCQNFDDGDSPKVPTPHFDRLASQGMRFSDAHSGSAVCTPTRYGLLTGRYAWRTRLTRGVLWGYDQPLIDDNRLTLPQLLKRHGYATAGNGKWHLGLDWTLRAGATSNEDVDYSIPFRHGPTSLGFDRYFGIPASLDMDPYVYIRDDRLESLPTERIAGSPRPAFYRGGPIAPGFSMEGVMPRLTSEAVCFIEDRKQRPDEPFFLYFPTTSPHTPHVPNRPFHGRSASGIYGDFVVEWDDAVGQVLRALDDAGLAENTLVIVTSDNGADLRGGQPEHGHDSNGHLAGQKADIWDGGHRIPFAARWPGTIPAGTVCNQTICLTDLIATFADLLGSPFSPTDGRAEAPDSVSFLPALRGQRIERDSPPLRDLTVHHAADGMFAARSGPWKLVLGHGSGGFSRPVRLEPAPGDPPGRLYHLWDDVQETTNLWTERPEIVAQLTTALERERAR